MFSVKHHLAFWALSATATTIYLVLTSILSVPEAVFQYLLPPSTAYLLYVLWHGPGSPVPTVIHRIATGFMLVSLGSVSTCLQIPEDWKASEGGKENLGVLVHALSAFVLLGIVESIRNNASGLLSSNIYKIRPTKV